MSRLNSHNLMMDLIDVGGEPGCEKLGIAIAPQYITISSENHGTCGECDDNPIQEGQRAIIVIERYQEQLRCLVWADINQEDPTHIISLDSALLSKRNQQTEA